MTPWAQAYYRACLRFPTFPNTFHPWKERNPLDLGRRGAVKRRQNLERYLSLLEDPQFILVGEAASYNGCAHTGIAFTDERQFAGDNGVIFSTFQPTSKFGCIAENSAGVIWRATHDVWRRVLLCNTFPLHPYQSQSPFISNRKPTREEIEAGARLIRLLHEKLPEAQFVAIGRVAQSTIGSILGKEPVAIRHPAYGGAVECHRGIRTLLGQKGLNRATEHQMGLFAETAAPAFVC